ncbi:cellulose synthase/poly-beta-1,6-N-acetylglucosamine synthase-like glycosyltransferase [Chitinophaga niastensis]|uniref:Cellulose synthase/poly-beta-1,6-N-acetylglucosamine synthase-like glycosyltransferase n=1 Tax=Chitinophaga niastensis TaxID=536980 RepID=A0A2P8HC03_CHINA|nr:glycosyltransferase family 2 protein [Chitinophaga niastensis]PSL43744.1 cellulose synthase/poly-beta-1,6-N-acetylglucosamine synthase-like glycosyltransferase [Chitinophaga niastensis]
MTILVLFFWISLFFVFYSYIGYGLLLYILVKIKQLVVKPLPAKEAGFQPEVTFMVAAYNEADFIRHKIENTLELDYPVEKLTIIFVTDGSSDDTNSIIKEYPQTQLLYEPQRSGKTVAINRAMAHVTTPFVIFSDANTLLNPQAVNCMISHFSAAEVGAVAGEKKVISDNAADAEGAGEGMYWKYESLLKKWDAALYSVMGAAGELFAIRTSLYENVPADTILDDFTISFGVNKKGYKVAYAPDAYAREAPSSSLQEEYKRKVRISAGGFQAMYRLSALFNFFRYPKITWQFVSHRVFRWTVAPLCLLLLLLTNIGLCIATSAPVYRYVLILQSVFYTLAFIGYLMAIRQMKSRYFYVPFYFVFMNVAVFHGFIRYLKKKQSAVWERSQRQITIT